MDNSKRRNFYKDIEELIKKNKFKSKNLTNTKREILEEYSNISIIHNELKIHSVLNKNLIDVTKNVDVFKNINTERISLYKEHITIPFKSQEDVYKSNRDVIDLSNFNYDIAVKLLNEISELYSNSFTSDEYLRISYFAVLLTDWVNGEPLIVIINKALRYFEKNPNKFYLNHIRVEYAKEDPIHINEVINNTIQDIENKIKYSLKKYISNYIKIQISKGIMCEEYHEVSDFVEFGSNNRKVIQLQKLGFSRELSYLLVNEYDTFITFDGEDIVLDYINIIKELSENELMYEEFKIMYDYEMGLD